MAVEESVTRVSMDPKCVSVLGSRVSRRFFLQLSGTGEVAVENLERFLTGLRDHEGEWIPVHVFAPSALRVHCLFNTWDY